MAPYLEHSRAETDAAFRRAEAAWLEPPDHPCDGCPHDDGTCTESPHDCRWYEGPDPDREYDNRVCEEAAERFAREQA